MFKMNTGKYIFILMLIITLGFVAGCGANTKKAEKEKSLSGNIELFVGFPAGGSFDLLARLLTPYLQQNLPETNIIVKNIPGGDGVLGVNELYKAKPDGHSLALFSLPGNTLKQATGETTWDLRECTWIAQVVKTPYLGVVSGKSGINSFDDLKKLDRIRVGTIGINSTTGINSILVAEKTGLNFKLIAHQGGGDAMLACIRGDVDFIEYPYATCQQNIEQGNLKPIVIFSDKRMEELPNVPTIVECGYPDLANVGIIYAIGGTPGISKETADILSEAFQKSINNPEYIKKMKDVGMDVIYKDGEGMKEVIEQQLNDFKDAKTIIDKYSK